METIVQSWTWRLRPNWQLIDTYGVNEIKGTAVQMALRDYRGGGIIMVDRHMVRDQRHTQHLLLEHMNFIRGLQ